VRLVGSTWTCFTLLKKAQYGFQGVEGGSKLLARVVIRIRLSLKNRMRDTCAMIHIQSLIDDAKCFETVRALRWPDGVHCSTCHSPQVTKQGHDDTQPARQRYQCTSCGRRFDDLTGTIFAGHHQPLRVWILCLYLMGLNLSNHQIAQELDLNKDDAHQMTCQLRQGIVTQKPTPTLTGEVECDEVYIVAGHKGQPEAVVKKGGADGGAGSRGSGDAARLRARSRRSSG
jgi:transposase-like protein